MFLRLCLCHWLSVCVSPPPPPLSQLLPHGCKICPPNCPHSLNPLPRSWIPPSVPWPRYWQGGPGGGEEGEASTAWKELRKGDSQLNLCSTRQGRSRKHETQVLASRPSFQGRHIPGGGNPSDRWGVRGLILDLGLCTCFSVWHLNPPPWACLPPSMGTRGPSWLPSHGRHC